MWRDQGVCEADRDIFFSLLCKPVGRGSGGLASHTRTFPDLVTPRAFSLHLANEILGSFGPKETPLCSYRKFWLKRQTVLDFEQEINCKFPSIYWTGKRSHFATNFCSTNYTALCLVKYFFFLAVILLRRKPSDDSIKVNEPLFEITQSTVYAN